MTNLATVNELQTNETSAIALAKNPDDWFEKKFEQQMEKYKANKIPSMAIVVTKGSLDWAYPPFILASSAAALGWDVELFFTFYGLSLLKKDLDLEISPLGKPAMTHEDAVWPGMV